MSAPHQHTGSPHVRLREALQRRAVSDNPNSTSPDALAVGYLTVWMAAHCCPTLLTRLLHDLEPTDKEPAR